MRAFVLALLLGCAPTAMTTTAEHPASSDAPTGRLAGPPAALRPGVADVSIQEAPSAPASASPALDEHAGHGSAPPATEPAKPATEKPRKPAKPPASKVPAKDTPPAKKPGPPPPAQGHEGHH